jgi:predicted  nucleic acid-binding Zn-ribbon protein
MPHECNECGAAFPERRALLGYRLCLTCGEKAARAVKHCTVPGHKQGYMVITNREELRGINNKSVPT